MRKISGWVLVKETNTGVPNIIVVAYDCKQDIQHLRGQPPSAELMRLLGRRIASVLTDTKGQFILTAEDLAFQGNEERPDLIVALFASEDVLGVREPMPRAPEERLLYVSAVPRTDAGAEEAYVIRLLQAQIEEFSIPISSAVERGAADANHFANSVQRTWAFRDGVKAALRQRLQSEADAAGKRRKDAREFFKDLSGIPLHLRDDMDKGRKNALFNNDFLVGSRADLADKLATLQTTAVIEGLKRLDQAKVKPTVRLHLSPTQLETLGLKQEGGKISGTVDSQALNKAVRSLMDGVDLRRVRGHNNPPPEILEQRYLTLHRTKLTDSEGQSFNDPPQGAPRGGDR